MAETKFKLTVSGDDINSAVNDHKNGILTKNFRDAVNEDGTAGSGVGMSNTRLDGLGKSAMSIGERTLAKGTGSLAGGFYSQALAPSSTAFGQETIASESGSLAIGKYNTPRTVGRSPIIFSIGNGSSINARHNAASVRLDGTAWFARNIYIGGRDEDDKYGTLDLVKTLQSLQNQIDALKKG